MAMPRCAWRWSGPGALPGRTGPGAARSAPAASGAGARRRSLGAQTFLVFTFLLQVLSASATATGQLAAPRGWNCSLTDKCCPAGTHASEDGRECVSCTDGEDYTLHRNKLFSCLPCTTCKSDKEERSPCTRTKDTQCECKPGTFQRQDSPEFCRKCSTGCPEGMVVAKNCTPWSDLKCVKEEQGSSQLKRGIIAAAVTVPVVLLLVAVAVTCACYHRRRIQQACGVDPECVNTDCFRCSRLPRKPGALDNARNEIISHRDSLSTVASEQELGRQARVESAGVTAQSPVEEAERLLGPAGAEGSPRRRRQLVPANGADPIESLKLFFNYIPGIVPFNSWNPLMRLLGLKDNDICVARAQALDPREALYAMLVTWINNRGRAASVNTVLDALETLGEKNALESIQDQLVSSGKYIYEEAGAGLLS